MTDKIITDNEIKSALKGAILNAKGYDSKVWSIEVYKLQNALDLIKRQEAEIDQYAEEQHELMIEKDNLFDIAEKQKAEIERLREECGNQSNLWSNHYESIFETAKAEAVKEFAERLKKRMGFCDLPNVIVRSHIDNLLKETVGDADGKREEEIP